MDILKYIFITFVSLFTCTTITANQKPYVTNLSRDKYHGANKNWSIGQDEKGIMYFGNAIGLLESDGMEWRLFQTPDANIVRAIAVVDHQTIYSGGSEDLGRWDRDQSGQLKYTSLKGLLKGNNPLDNQSFWRIWIVGDKVYFQSFSHVYMYDHQTLTLVDGPTDLLLLLKVRDEYWVQEMYGALYQLDHLALNKIPGSEFLNGTVTRVILPYGTDRYLIGTSTGEIYIYDKEKFIPWNPSLSRRLQGQELNCGIYSSKRNTYYLGTQLSGVYEVDTQGNILNHFSAANSLQNNTILSLYEDNQNNVWAAMDRGLAYIRYTDGLSYYRSTDGGFGAVYDATIWHGNLLVGTNQGIYYTAQKKIDDLDMFSSLKLIEGTQGQVWSFQQIGGKLFCGHTNGLLEILPDLRIRQSYHINTGVFRTLEATINGKQIQIIITYKDLLILNQSTGELSSMGQISDPISNAEVDHLGNIWLETTSRGVYKCRLNDELNAFRYYTYYGKKEDNSLPEHLRLFKSGGRILFLGDDQFYIYNEGNDDLQIEQHLNQCFKDIHNLKRIIPFNSEESWATTGSSVYLFFYDGYIARIKEAYKIEADNLSLVTAYENAAVLNDSLSLICLDAGFILHNVYRSKRQTVELSAPNLEFVHTGTGAYTGYVDLNQPIHVPYKDNTVTVGFSVNAAFAGNLFVQYQLEEVDSTWSASERRNSISYARLPKGTYTLRLRTTDGLNNYSPDTLLTFEVLPPWYNTIWWYLTCCGLIIIALFVTFYLMKRRLQTKHLRRMKAQEAAHLRSLNEQLQNEIEEKDAELFTQTSFIIHKNELILKLKEIVDEICARNTQKGLMPFYQKINTLLANNLDTEDDWKMFLIKFEQKHRNFFRRLKEMHPQLTNNDLRLCACLKLNMETKDIAALMNLSVRAVENNRYRLRKKFNLQPTQNLNEYFLSID
ncbi:helix-turn-helix and ligand-binding sensor domain-containing protein [Bacteroides oleiciplenus]|uniref:Two component regulator three Y domain-containing protein n=1 Tax=Bacteroides oleiciplenus TaxID=626931 RepID=A0A3E5BPL6_9BACE|nr:triple tyrosine motif-containing protein [Bacteroides oleiciplenus]RGN39313.1 hypothetical protein DXB65_03000 [Bacteroides oleiciplenus]